MKAAVLLAGLLVAAIALSGCTQQSTSTASTFTPPTSISDAQHEMFNKQIVELQQLYSRLSGKVNDLNYRINTRLDNITRDNCIQIYSNKIRACQDNCELERQINNWSSIEQSACWQGCRTFLDNAGVETHMEYCEKYVLG